MALSIAQRIQRVTPDSIAYAGDMELAVRANGEEETSIIDLAGNFYPAGVPAPTFTPTLNGTTPLAGTLEAGFYAYRYVYAATKRYPLVDAGIGIGGSIAPRGNPSATLVVESPAVGPNRVTINVQYNVRLDVTELWIFRSIRYATAADAQVAGDAGLVFYMGKVTNVNGTGFTTYQDNSKDIATSAQVELDNFFAPTFKYVRYIPPYFWGIGNDDLLVEVTWANNVVTVANATIDNPVQAWFSGRNGQIATVTGLVTGGFDGKGKFFFKVGDTTGNNPNYNAILTLDGSTPATLDPPTGSGFLKVTGPGATLFRSKPRNPFAWGFTQIFGASRIAQTYGILVGSGKATGIIALPGDELLKIDLKNPNVCYTFNLKIAAFPEFSTTRRAISKNSISSHFSQFYANTGKQQKVVWGFDADNFAILQCDGNSQVPVTDSLWQTFRKIDRDPSRLRRIHGVCDEENQLNVMWIGQRGRTNEADPIDPTQYPESKQITDLMVAHHYPSDKWSIGYDFDLTCSAAIRDIGANNVKILGGHQSGIVGHILNNTVNHNFGRTHANFAPAVASQDSFNSTITLAGGSFTGLVDPTPDEARVKFVGLWGALYRYQDPAVTFVRIAFIEGDTFGYDMVFTDYRPDLYEGSLFKGVIPDPTFAPDPTSYLFILGDINALLKKTMNFKAPSKNKRFQRLYLNGKNLDTSLVFILNGPDDTATVTRVPQDAFNRQDDLTKLTENSARNIWQINRMAIPASKEIGIWVFTNTRTQDCEFRNIILNLADR